MLELSTIAATAAVPIALAFVLNTFAEWALLKRENQFVLAIAKSVKAIIIPALIATYALIIASVIAGANA